MPNLPSRLFPEGSSRGGKACPAEGQSQAAAFLPGGGVRLCSDLPPSGQSCRSQAGGLLAGNGSPWPQLGPSGAAAGVQPWRLRVGRAGWWPGAVYQRTKTKGMLENTHVSDPQVPAALDWVSGGLMLQLVSLSHTSLRMLGRQSMPTAH